MNQSYASMWMQMLLQVQTISVCIAFSEAWQWISIFFYGLFRLSSQFMSRKNNNLKRIMLSKSVKVSLIVYNVYLLRDTVPEN